MQLLTLPMPLSPEVIDDRVATVLDAGDNITLNYDDAANVLTISAASGGAPTNAEYITSTADATLSAERVLTDTATVSWDRSTPGQIKATAGGVGGYTNEDAQDAVGTILQDSATVDFIYNDATPYITGVVKDNSITESMLSLSDNTTKDSTIAAHGLLMKLSGNTVHFLRGDGTWVTPPTGTTYTNEDAQDAVGTILADTATIDFTYTDATPSITASVIAGSIGTTQLANDAVTYAKLQNVTDARLLGRSAGSAGDAQEITVGSGLSLSAGTLTASGGGTYTNEEAQDAVGSILANSLTINLTYNDATPEITASVVAGSFAPPTAQYITAAANSTLQAERVLVDTATVTWDFGTAAQAKANAISSADTSRGIHFLFMGA